MKIVKIHNYRGPRHWDTELFGDDGPMPVAVVEVDGGYYVVGVIGDWEQVQSVLQSDGPKNRDRCWVQDAHDRGVRIVAKRRPSRRAAMAAARRAFREMYKPYR